MFYNRYQGNFEYDSYLRLAPNAYNVGAGYTDAKSYGLPFLSFDNARQINFQQRIGSLGINTPSTDSFSWPTTHSFSVSYARRIPWNQVVEVAYVGTRGRDLVSRTNGNVMPFGVMSSGSFNGVDLSVADQPRCRREREQQPRVVPSVQRAVEHHDSMTSVASATTTRCRSR